MSDQSLSQQSAISFTRPSDTPSTSAHPPSQKPDPTTASAPNPDASGQGRVTASPNASSAAELAQRLKSALRQYPDFPSPGILFEDILPIFANHSLHEALIQALELQIAKYFGQSQKPDVVVGLDARGFLFGPTLALRLGAGFIPVRKRGKLPGPTATASFEKEYGEDYFQMQTDGIRPGQRVIIVDDIIATGGSASAAGSLVKQAGGNLLGYIFLLELDFLKGRDKLDAPVHTLLSSQEGQS